METASCTPVQYICLTDKYITEHTIPPNKFIVPDSRYIIQHCLYTPARRKFYIHMKARTSPETNNKLRLS